MFLKSILDVCTSVTCLYMFTSIPLLRVSGESSKVFKNYAKSTLNDVILTNNLLSGFEARSTFDCASACTGTAVCSAFTFTTASGMLGSCRTHSSTMTSRADTMAVPGTTLYETRVRNCQEVRLAGLTGDVHRLVIADGWSVEAACDDDWTIFQRRHDGSVDFYRGWDDYVTGFGNVSGEYWLGLEAVHAMTVGFEPQELQVDVRDWNGTLATASYSRFSLGSSASNYSLHYDTFLGGSAGDSLWTHKDRQFSTKDRDNDLKEKYSCAVRFLGAWWFKACHRSNLNGEYKSTHDDANNTGLLWEMFRGYKYSCSFAQMKFRAMP